MLFRMRRPRLLVLGSWVVATALATLISAAGVSIVTRDVTSDHGPALAAADVVALLSADEDAAEAAELPRPPSTTAPPAPSATFATRGGVISVACTGSDVTLLSARPVSGFQVQVRDAGPEAVEVRFNGEGRDVGTVAAACAAGVPAVLGDRPGAPVEGTEPGERAERSGQHDSGGDKGDTVRDDADDDVEDRDRRGRGEDRRDDEGGSRADRSGNRRGR
jgi:hypothetical protein